MKDFLFQSIVKTLAFAVVDANDRGIFKQAVALAVSEVKRLAGEPTEGADKRKAAVDAIVASLKAEGLELGKRLLNLAIELAVVFFAPKK